MLKLLVKYYFFNINWESLLSNDFRRSGVPKVEDSKIVSSYAKTEMNIVALIIKRLKNCPNKKVLVYHEDFKFMLIFGLALIWGGVMGC